MRRSATNKTEEGTGASAGLRWFPGREALHGFWLGPDIDLSLAGKSLNGGKALGAGAALVGIVGYTFRPTEHETLALGVGGGCGCSRNIATSATGQPVGKNEFGAVVTGRFAVGCAW